MNYLIGRENFTKISETEGTLQNASKITTIEVSDLQTQNNGLLLPPLGKIILGGDSIYVRCVDGAGAEVRVVPFEAAGEGGGGGGKRSDFAVDQMETNVVDNFLFSALEYPNATNPNLDGKTVLVLAVKDANGKSDVVKYIFVDLAKVVDVYSAGDSSILVTDGNISVRRSQAQGNILSLADDGLFAELVVSGGVSGNFAVIGTSGLITDGRFNLAEITASIDAKIDKVANATAGDFVLVGASGAVVNGGFNLADLGLQNKMDKVPTAVQNNVAIFGTSGAVADGGFNFADIEESIDAKIDKVTSPTQGDIVIFGLSGALADGGFSFADIADSIDAKVDKVTTATSGHIAVFNSIGSVVDGGFSIADLQYELPVASASVLGGFKVGSGLSMSGESLNVTLEVPEEYTLPTASASLLGGVKIGDGLSMTSNGVLNVTLQGGGSSSAVVSGGVLSTVASTVDGGFWYEVLNGVPVLKLHHGNYDYSFDYDTIRLVGDVSNVLVAYLPFTSSVTDDSCGNEWTTYGSPAIVEDVNAFGGNSLSLNGSSYLYNDTISASIGSSSFTIDFWASATSGTAFFGTFNALYPNTTNQWVGIKWNGGTLALHFYANDPAGSITVQSGTRHHCAFTYDGTTVRLFVDGVLSIERTHQITLGGNFVIGSTANRAENITGRIDHFRVFNTALWTEPFTPPTASDYI